MIQKRHHPLPRCQRRRNWHARDAIDYRVLAPKVQRHRIQRDRTTNELALARLANEAELRTGATANRRSLVERKENTLPYCARDGSHISACQKPLRPDGARNIWPLDVMREWATGKHTTGRV